jgi:mycoredoxin
MSIRVFGALWCLMTTGTLRHLDELGVKYDFIDVETDRKAAEWVRRQNDGKERKPTLDMDGVILSEPSDAEVDRVLKELDFA